MSLAGQMVQDARRVAGLTQRGLAAAAGIPQETIARIERGRADPRVMTLDRLLQACSYGIESTPRPGIGVERTPIRARITVSTERRHAGAVADDEPPHVPGRRRSRRATGTRPSSPLPTVLL